MNKQKIMHFARYAIVSGVALAVDVGLLVTCHQFLGMHYLAAATIGFLSGVIVNYVLGILWVFHESRFASRGVEFLVTAGVAAIGLVINDAMMWLLIERLAVFYLIAKGVAAFVVFFWNFFIRQKYIHAPANQRVNPMVNLESTD